ncbi:MAG TPA: CHRD domain-containing protein [Chryseosolibacter sp.]|nr:CHRD domain-containing protein [Chryseosolibacter sp.]
MKIAFRMIVSLCVVSGMLVFLSGCDDEDEATTTGESKEFVLFSRSNPNISGTVLFEELSDNTAIVTIDLAGTQSGSTHPAHIHMNTAAQGGDIAIDLAAIDGATGMSKTVVKVLNSGTPVTYDELLEFDGYVNVHASPSDLATLIAQGDIGQNELTGNTEVYNLYKGDAMVGSATFAERVNSETLVTIDMDGTASGMTSPAHIHMNAAAQGGGIAVDLTAVNGATGMSLTNISQLNNGDPITYEELLEYNGYINVHLSAADLANIIAQGDIGGNELTGTSKTYVLSPVSNPNISGNVTFAERKNGFSLVTISLQGTSAGGNHPAHIHVNDVATTGGIAKSLSNVDGATGKSRTDVRGLDNATAITYAQLLAFNGYVNVHLSAADLATLIAQGNIGSNAD